MGRAGLVAIDPAVGLTFEVVERLKAWSEHVSA